MTDAPSTVDILCPFPGLRPFQREESDFFFGREEHIDELLGKLESNRFVAVVGASGCGKSSLVRAGLLPMLENGFMAEAGPNWRMATLRPGNAPFAHLAAALLEEGALGQERNELPNASAHLEAILRRGRLGLVDAMRETLLPDGTNLLVLVDQFEEIFRYREQSSVDEAEAFVELLLAAAQHRHDPQKKRRDAPVYVLLTMRSDFVGDCAYFLGLPEAINASQFLTPRLNRDQCRAAIVGPARALNGDVESPLVNHLLNNLRADADHLPLLQHVLMRMWRTAVAENTGIAPTLTLSNLTASGGMDHALSAHADEAFQELSPQQQQIAGCMFRALCEMGTDGRAIRRLVRVDEVASIAETTPDQVYPVVDVFRHQDRSFLMPPPGVPLSEATVLDISHESLIRQWKRLTDWVSEEAASARTYRRLAQTARLWKKGEAALWRTPDLELAEVWRGNQKPNSAWASRYGGELDLNMEFLNASVNARSRRQRIQRWRMVGAFATVLAVAAVTGVAAYIANNQRRVAQVQQSRAEKQSEIAHNQTQIAVRETKLAEEQKLIAEEQRGRANVEAERAKRSSYNAAFTGILDQWRLNRNVQDFKKRLDGFSEGHREFTWYFCRSLAESDVFEPQILESKHGAVNAVAFLGDDVHLVSGSEQGQLQSWDAAGTAPTTAPIWASPKGKPVLAAKTSPATHLIAFGTDDGAVGVVDYTSRKLLHVLDHGGQRVRTLAFSPDGSILATAGDDNKIALWKMPSGEPLRVLSGHADWISKIEFSPDGRSIASASYDKTIRIWSINESTPPVILNGHQAPVLSIAFAPDGQRLASGSDDRTIKLWDIRGQKCRETVNGHAASVNAIAFSPNGELLASGDGDGELRMWSVENYACHERVSPQRRHQGAINEIVFSPSGSLFATGSSDATVMLWDANFGLRLDSQRAEFRLAAATAVAFTADSPRLASVNESGVIDVWKRNEGDRFIKDNDASKTLDAIHDATAICFRSRNESLAIGTKGGSVFLSDGKALKKSKPDEQHAATVRALAFDETGKWLASADEQGSVSLWNTDGPQLQRKSTWKRHTAAVRSLSFAPEIAGKKWLASASEDGTVRVWDLDSILKLENEKLPSAIGEHEIVVKDHEDWVDAVAFSPTQPILASAGEDGTIRLREWDNWSLADKPQRKLILTGQSGAVTAIAFSQDGKTLATGGVDKMIRLWDPSEGHLRLVLPGHLASVSAVSFITRGTASGSAELASLSKDGVLKFWRAEAKPASATTANVPSR